jgi:tetratricopeptide (TPR) repeat protein
MTELAFAAHQWTDVVRYTNKVLALNPLNFPDAWFYNSVANFFLQNFPAAANSAEQGIKVDEQHKIPKLEYVLGMALINMKNLQAASEHMQRYLHLAKEPADIAEAQKELATIQRLSAEASVPADKK